jgi:hypothetical protein
VPIARASRIAACFDLRKIAGGSLRSEKINLSVVPE